MTRLALNSPERTVKSAAKKVVNFFDNVVEATFDVGRELIDFIDDKILDPIQEYVFEPIAHAVFKPLQKILFEPLGLEKVGLILEGVATVFDVANPEATEKA